MNSTAQVWQASCWRRRIKWHFAVVATIIRVMDIWPVSMLLERICVRKLTKILQKHLISVPQLSSLIYRAWSSFNPNDGISEEGCPILDYVFLCIGSGVQIHCSLLVSHFHSNVCSLRHYHHHVSIVFIYELSWE